jgi:hypothetical protein
MKTYPRHVNKVSRQVRAFQLRRQGFSYEEIGNALGVSGESARRYVKESVEKAQVQLEAEAHDHLVLSISRIERLMAAHWENALKGDTKAGAFVLNLQQELNTLYNLKKQAENKGGDQYGDRYIFFGDCPTAELVSLARQRGIPVPAVLEGLPGGDGQEAEGGQEHTRRITLQSIRAPEEVREDAEGHEANSEPSGLDDIEGFVPIERIREAVGNLGKFRSVQPDDPPPSVTPLRDVQVQGEPGEVEETSPCRYCKVDLLTEDHHPDCPDKPVEGTVL